MVLCLDHGTISESATDIVPVILNHLRHILDAYIPSQQMQVAHPAGA
jgi:hypothetical protein